MQRPWLGTCPLDPRYPITGHNKPEIDQHARRPRPSSQTGDTVHRCALSAPGPPHAHTRSESSAGYHSQGRHGTHLTWSIRTNIQHSIRLCQ